MAQSFRYVVSSVFVAPSVLGRFDNIHPGLSCGNALEILSTPVEELESQSDLYMAAAHLINCPGEETERALIHLLDQPSSHQAVKIAKRKAVETLARLSSIDSIASIGRCLWSDDPYLVENSVCALQRMGYDSPELTDRMLQLLSRDTDNQRVIIQYMSALSIDQSVDFLPDFLDSSNPGVRGAAIAALAKLTGDVSMMSILVDHLALQNQMDRQCAVQDLIDAKAIDCLPDLSVAPVSPAFRLRACRLLTDKTEKKMLQNPIFLQCVDSILIDNPMKINIVHQYDEIPALDFLVRELFNVDFSRCYLSMRTLQEYSSEAQFPLLVKAWEDEAHNDYGAHYFFMRLFGSRLDWPQKSFEWIKQILNQAAINQRPQFQKSRSAAMMAYVKLWPHQFQDFLDECLDESLSPPWDCRYAVPLLLDHLEGIDPDIKKSFLEKVMNDRDAFVCARANKSLSLLLR